MQDTRVNVALVNLIHGSHFSATEVIIRNVSKYGVFIELHYLQEFDVSQSSFM